MNLVNSIAVELEGDFTDGVCIWHYFLEVVNALPYVTVLATCKHDFPNGGFSGVVIIGESHAAIHTWPEFNRAWVELVTCGDIRALEVFRQKLSERWKVN